jgi:hypothetical protein
MQESLEKHMAYFASKHNEIAAKYNINYNFALPSFDDGMWAEYFDSPTMFVLFQGYPYGSGTGEVYNRFFSSASQIVKSNTYYIEQKTWYSVYHLSSCPLLEDGNIIYKDLEKKPYYHQEDCVAQGAYACPECIENGIYAPDYSSPVLADTYHTVFSIDDWDDEKLGYLYGINGLSLSTHNGILFASISGADPCFSLDHIVTATEVQKIRAYIRLTGNATYASQLFFAPAGGTYTEDKSVSKAILTSGSWQWVDFDVSKNANWKDQISKFRFDIAQTSGGTLEISEIQFLGK